MKANVGTMDRIIRVAIGLLILSLMLFVPGNARWLALIGLVPIATGLFGFCPAYTLVGISTCRVQGKHP